MKKVMKRVITACLAFAMNSGAGDTGICGGSHKE